MCGQTQKKVKKVVIVQRTLKFYRIPFYNLLKEACEKNDIQLVLLYGTDDIIKFNDAEIEWGIRIKNYKINLFKKNLYYQPVLKYIKDADLIIVEQASKLLINYYLWILNLLGRKRLAFWGHGINFQNDSSNRLGEFVKKFMTRKVRWFFAYNDLSRRVVENMGFPKDKITTVYNTIGVENILKANREWNEENLACFKEQLGIESKNICIFIGGMYKEKRLDLLLDSVFIVKNVIKDLQIIVIGDGPDKGKVLEACTKNNWIHYFGVKNDFEKIPYFLMSKLVLISGLVGLAIIDSFIFAVPLVTANSNIHSPEIDYLENHKNGIMAGNNITDYSSAIIDLLLNEEKRLMLVEGCKESAKKYTMENMVNNFSEGIVNALNISSINVGNLNA